jgi:hypothetical protein
MSDSITARPGPRFTVPRGLITGTLAAIGLVWGVYELTGGSLLSAQVQTGIYLGLLLLTTRARPSSTRPRPAPRQAVPDPWPGIRDAAAAPSGSR